jgi:hypothetical protein
MISSYPEVFLEDYNCHETLAHSDAVDLAGSSRPQGQVLFLKPHKLFAESTHSTVKKC